MPSGRARRLLFRIAVTIPAVFHAVDLDDIALGYDSADDLEGLLIRPFAVHDVRGRLGVDFVATFEEIADRVQCSVEGQVRAR
jgi:hypothetical protein